MPLPRSAWRPPSQAEPRDQLGHPTYRVTFRLTARLDDGLIRWRGWFESREDADAFLFALSAYNALHEPIPPSLRRLPTPHWHPDIGPHVTYEFASPIFITTVGSPTWTSLADWNNSANTVHIIGGAGGGAGGSGTFHACGGGAGGYRGRPNYVVATPGTTVVNTNIGSGGAARIVLASSLAGLPGLDSWWDTGLAANSAPRGLGGGVGSAAANGGAGGAPTAGGSDTVSNGGAGGNLSGASGSGGSGGGGGGGPAGAGSAGVSSASTGSAIQTAGGAANNGATAGGAVTAGGGSGTEFDGSHGIGSGGGGSASTSADITGGSGGNYGGGGAGARTAAANTATSGAGVQGMIVLVYTPVVAGQPFVKRMAGVAHATRRRNVW